jgi:hypothetical protein
MLTDALTSVPLLQVNAIGRRTWRPLRCFYLQTQDPAVAGAYWSAVTVSLTAQRAVYDTRGEIPLDAQKKGFVGDTPQ